METIDYQEYQKLGAGNISQHVEAGKIVSSDKYDTLLNNNEYFRKLYKKSSQNK